MNLRVGPGNGSLAYTGDGVRIPSDEKPSAVFRKLFVQGSPSEVAAQVRRLKDGQSLMDSFGTRIRTLQGEVSGSDKDRLEQYFTSVREVEKRLILNEAWEKQPKPTVSQPAPRDVLDPGALVQRTRNMYDLTRLALETDSTRLVTILVTQGFNPKVNLPGVTLPHHALTHQAQQSESREQLRVIEEAQMAELGRLLTGLSERKESGSNLLNQTMVLQGSAMGHAGKHDNSNLPILLAGGSFRHGQHLVFDQTHNTPFANVFVSMLQQLGIETTHFSSGTRTLKGLDVA